jgi:hypothetical protein
MSQTFTFPRDINVNTDGQTVTIYVPLMLRRIGGRKRVISPPGATAWMPPRPEINSPLLHALVRAFHWQSLLDDGHFASVNELAKAQGKNASYVAAVLRLTLLAPDIVEAVLDGRQPSTLQLQPLMRKGVPVAWDEQRSNFDVCSWTRPGFPPQSV